LRTNEKFLQGTPWEGKGEGKGGKNAGNGLLRGVSSQVERELGEEGACMVMNEKVEAYSCWITIEPRKM